MTFGNAQLGSPHGPIGLREPTTSTVPPIQTPLGPSTTLGLNVELRNIYADADHLAALREVRGRTTVPVLRISSPDGEERWMPESADIVQYLQASYGQEAA